MGKIMNWLGWPVSADEQIESVTRFLMIVGVLALVIIIAFGVAKGGASFLLWGLIAAFGAFLFGSAFGLLFGLPTSQRVTVTTSGSGGGTVASAGPPTGYTDSTSLEQIAVWLTSIIVGLSLVNFRVWRDEFNEVAGNLSLALFPPVADATGKITSLVPFNPAYGGFILGGFALLGFLLSYLWMRRYFIRAMVRGNIQSQREVELAEQRRKEEAARVSQAQTQGNVARGAATSPDAMTLQNQLAAASSVAESVVSAVSRQTSKEFADKAKAIKEAAITPQDKEDPWRGAFGGVASANNSVMSATIKELESTPDYFQIDISVSIIDEARRAELSGTDATIYLHPTFGSDPRVVPFNTAGVASLQIFAWGAFTVGALLKDGTTLELNLADQPGATDKFRAR
jgi:hypothetical protein